MKPLIVIPAAGASSRMRGRDKLLEEIDGKPLLRRQAEAALATGCQVLVALPERSPREASLTGLKLALLTVPDASEGMGATLRTAAKTAGDRSDRPMMILLPDVPDIGTDDIACILARFEAEGSDTVTRASDDEHRPGTPLIVPARLVEAFTHLNGDDGGRGALKGEAVILVPIPDNRATRDLDTPEDWERWRGEKR